MSAASDNLRAHQRQLDQDGIEVGVSRQAVHDVLSEYGAVIEALQAIADGEGDAVEIARQTLEAAGLPLITR